MASGYKRLFCTDEQQAVEKLKTFLVDDIGWQVEEDITDTASDRDITFSSDGEDDVANAFTRYIRLRGTGNEIKLFTYETYIDSITNTGEVSDSSYGHVTTGSSPFILTAVADKERLTFQVEEESGDLYYGYVGRIDSYYRASQHKYPNLVKGCDSSSQDWFYDSAERNMWMRAADGTVQHYLPVSIVSSSQGVSQGGISDRADTQFVFKLPIGRLGNDSNDEIAGEVRGLYRVANAAHQPGQFIAIDTKLYVIFSTGISGYKFANGPVHDNGLTLPSNDLE